MKFAPEYVTYVLNENFEDAKALFLAPLMAIHYAHLVMLADAGHRLAPTTRTRIRDGARRRSRRTTSARSRYDGTYEDLFFYVERLIVAGLRRRRRRPAAHRAQPQRHRHDDVPDAAARVRCSALIGGDARRCARALLDLADRAPRDGVRRAHAHAARRSRPPSRTTCWRSSSSSSATPSRLQARVRAHQPQSARRLRDHRHRVSDRSRADARAARLRRPDRQHLRQHRHRRLPARERVGGGGAARRPRPRSSRTCCCGARRSSATCGSATASCRAAASCRRSAIRSRSSTRARSAARRSARRRRSSLTVHNTPFGDIVDTEDDLQPLVFAMFRDATRAVTLVAAAMRTARVRRRDGSRRAPATAGRR